MSKQDKMIEARKQTSNKKAEAVKAAVMHLKHTGQPVTVSNVARVAKVSRPFIQNHKELKALIPTESVDSAPQSKNHYHNNKSVKDMLANQRNALLIENERLRAQVDDLTKHDYKQKYEDLLDKYDKLKSDYDALFKALMDTPQSLDNFGTISANMDKMKQA